MPPMIIVAVLSALQLVAFALEDLAVRWLNRSYDLRIVRAPHVADRLEFDRRDELFTFRAIGTGVRVVFAAACAAVSIYSLAS
jgi:hypothetical protein